MPTREYSWNPNGVTNPLKWPVMRLAFSFSRRAEKDALAKELMLADPRNIEEACQAYDADSRYAGTLTQFIREFFDKKFDRGYARLPGYVRKPG